MVGQLEARTAGTKEDGEKRLMLLQAGVGAPFLKPHSQPGVWLKFE